MKKNQKQYLVKYDMLSITIIGTIYTIFLFIILWLLLYKFFDINKIVSELNIVVFTIVMIIWFILHEIIHGIFYIIGGAKKENICFGAALEKGIFYCKCKENINKKNILTSLIAPFTIIGIITLIISILIKDYNLLILSIFNMSGASADLLLFFFFYKRNKDILFREINDTTQFVLTTSENLTDKKFLGIKSIELIDNDDKKEDKDEKRIYISKPTYYIMILFIICLIISLL